jgi:hypothetical protein
MQSTYDWIRLDPSNDCRITIVKTPYLPPSLHCSISNFSFRSVIQPSLQSQLFTIHPPSHLHSSLILRSVKYANWASSRITTRLWKSPQTEDSTDRTGLPLSGFNGDHSSNQAH